MPKTVYRQEYRKLLDLLRQRRQEANVHQAVVAEALGRSQSFVSDVECGKARLDVMQFIDYCAAIGVSPSGLIEELMRPSRTRRRSG